MSTDENGTDNKSPFTSYSVKTMYSRVLCRITPIFFSSVNKDANYIDNTIHNCVRAC